MHNIVYSYRGPLGVFEGSWKQVFAMGQCHPKEVLIWRVDWKEWKSFSEVSPEIEAEHKEASSSSYRYSRKGKSYWYIGPRVMSEDMSFAEIAAEISVAPMEPHLISLNTVVGWTEWIHLRELYETVERNYPRLKLPPLIDEPKYRMLEKLTLRSKFDQHLKNGDLESFISKKISSHKKTVGQVIQAACQSQQGYAWEFSSFTEKCQMRLAEEMKKALTAEGKFYWPEVGPFTVDTVSKKGCLDRCTGKSYRMPVHQKIRFKASRRLRDLVNGRRTIEGWNSLGGEKNPWQNLHYWIATSNTSDLSRRRHFWMSLARGHSQDNSGDLPKVVSELQIYTLLMCHLIVQNNRVYVPRVGTFYVSDRADKKVLRFKAISAGNLASNKKNMSGIVQISKYKNAGFFENNVITQEMAEKMVADLASLDNPFLCARTLTLILRGFASGWPSKVLTFSAEVRVFLEEAHQRLAVEASSGGK